MSDIKIEAIRHSRSFDQEKRSPTSLDRSKFEKLSNKGALPPSRTQHAAASVEGGLYLIGGEVPIRDPKQDAQLLNDMYHYDLHQGLWSQVKQSNAFENWPDKRKGHTLVVNRSQTTLYLFGGMGTTAQASGRKSARGRPSVGKGQDTEDDAATGSDLIYYHDVWTFDITTKQWREVKIEGDKPTGRAFHSAVCVGDEQMLIFGGFGCHEDNDVWTLKLETMTWSKLELQEHSPRPSRRWRHISALYGNNFYVFGGQIKSRVCDTAVWKLNLQTFIWTRIDVPQTSSAINPCSRNDLAGCQFDNRWFVHGGNLGLTASTQRTTNMFHEFSFKSEKWRQLTSLFPTSPSLEGHQCTLLYDGPYVASIVLTNGGNITGSPPHWPQSGWRLDFLAPTASHGLSNKIEEMYLHPFVRDTILSLWRDLKSRESNALELMELKRKHADLLRDHANMTEKHEKVSKRLEDTISSLQATTESLQDLKSALADSQIVRERLSQQVSDLQSMVDTLERQNEARNNTIDHLQQQVKDAESNCTKVKEELDWCREQNEQRVDEFEREMELARERENEANAQREIAEREIERRGDLLEELGNRVKEFEESTRELKDENEQLMLDLETARATCKVTQAKLDEMQALHAEHVTQSTGEISQLQRTVDEMQETLNQKAQDIGSLSATISSLEKELSAVKQDAQHRLRDKDDNIKRLEKEVEQVSKNEADARNQVEVAKGRIKVLEERTRIMQQELTEYRKRYDDQRQETKCLNDRLRKETEDKEKYRSEVDDLRQELQRVSDLLSHSNKALEEEAKAHTTLKGDLRNAIEECTTLKKSLHELEQLKAQLESDQALLLTEKDALTSECDAARQQLTKAQTDLAALQIAQDDLNNAFIANKAALTAELSDAKNRNLNLGAELLSLQKEVKDNYELIKRFNKYLEAGYSLKTQIADVLRDQPPLSPASTVDISDFTP